MKGEFSPFLLSFCLDQCKHDSAGRNTVRYQHHSHSFFLVVILSCFVGPFRKIGRVTWTWLMWPQRNGCRVPCRPQVPKSARSLLQVIQFITVALGLFGVCQTVCMDWELLSDQVFGSHTSHKGLTRTRRRYTYSMTICFSSEDAAYVSDKRWMSQTYMVRCVSTAGPLALFWHLSVTSFNLQWVVVWNIGMVVIFCWSSSVTSDRPLWIDGVVWRVHKQGQLGRTK
jgi:hypothetical protein